MHVPENKPLRLGILGGGRAAWAYGSSWRRIGWPIDGVWLRAESQSKLPELLNVPRKQIEDLEADLLLVAVSDRAIADLCSAADSAANLDQTPPSRRRSTALFHASGAMPAPPNGFSLHPLKALPPVGTPSDLQGALLVFEGKHADIARNIAVAIGARFAEIAPEDKPRYHAGAVFGSNYVAAMLDVAERLIGIENARDDIVALAESAIQNWRAHTDARRFTGPAARGDQTVVDKHIAALAGDPQVQEIYKLLAEEIARAILAREK
ncbi:MAG TPA: DUF2520 domain-containing protein [Thermoanaerobaculia bacterium]|jgi:predicted short-subunit dehydrogenase-like oxidoreductase (DUF2520 family)